MVKYVCEICGEISENDLVRIGSHNYCAECVKKRMFDSRLNEVEVLEDEN